MATLVPSPVFSRLSLFQPLEPEDAVSGARGAAASHPSQLPTIRVSSRQLARIRNAFGTSIISIDLIPHGLTQSCTIFGSPAAPAVQPYQGPNGMPSFGQTRDVGDWI